jgi:hypothetical protein
LNRSAPTWPSRQTAGTLRANHAALDRIQELFVKNNLLALPIVSDLEGRRVIGMMRRFDISNAYLRRLQGSSNAPAAQKVNS